MIPYTDSPIHGHSNSKKKDGTFPFPFRGNHSNARDILFFFSVFPFSSPKSEPPTPSLTPLRLRSDSISLLEAIDSLQPPSRDVSKPLIMPICDVIRTQSMGQVAACGKLETGAVRAGSKVVVMPGCQPSIVRSIEQDSNMCSVARAGDNVAVILHGVDSSKLMLGGVALDGAVCVQEFSKCKALGRVFLRANGNTVVVEIVTRLIE